MAQDAFGNYAVTPATDVPPPVVDPCEGFGGGGCPTPSAPVATPATNVNVFSFSANWNAAAIATSYRLDLSTDPLFGSFVTGYQNRSVGNVTTLAIAGLDPGVDYYYRVRAVNACGTSGNSNTITGTTDDEAGKLILYDNVNPPVVVVDPSGIYDASDGPWTKVTATACNNLAGINLENSPSLNTMFIVECPLLKTLSITNSQLTNLELTGMSTTAINLNFETNAVLESVDVSQATSAAAIFFSDNPALVTLNFSSLTTITGNLTLNSNALTGMFQMLALDSVGGNVEFINNTGATWFDISGCTTIGGYCTISDNGAGVLEVVGLSTLVSCGGTLSIENNPGLTLIDVTALTTVGGNLIISNDSALPGISLFALETVTGEITMTGNPLLPIIELPLLATCGGMVVVGNEALEAISCPSLTEIFTLCTISTNTALETISFPQIIAIDATFTLSSNTLLDSVGILTLEVCGDIVVEGNPALLGLAFNALTTVGSIGVQGNINLASLIFQSVTSVNTVNIHDLTATGFGFPAITTMPGGMDLSGNPNLQTLNFNGQALTDGPDWIFSGCALVEASVDLVLAAGVAGSLSTGTIDLSGGSNNAPGVQGTIDAGILSGSGVTVLTN